MSADDLELLSLWIHVPIAVAWIGLVMWDVFTAAAPRLSPAQRGQMIAWSRWLAVVAIVVLAATGVYQTMNNPISPVGSFDELARLRERTAYGQALFLKHGTVLATVALTLVVRFGLAPRLARLGGQESGVGGQGPGAGGRGEGAVGTVTSEVAPLQRTILWLSVANLAACLGALMFATRMIYALH